MLKSRLNRRPEPAKVEVRRATGFVDPQWELATEDLEDVERWLLYWRNAPPALDEGMPVQLAEWLGAALARVARVTFLCDEARALPANWTALEEEVGLSLRVGGLLSQRFGFRSSTQAASVQQAFYDPQYPWANRAQMMLLSPRQLPPPALVGAPLEEVLFRRYVPDRPRIRRAHIHGLLFAGVDGDSAGLYLWDTGLVSALEKALAETAAQLQLPYRTVPEQELDAPTPNEALP